MWAWVLLSAGLWAAILLLPWRPWGTSEQISAAAPGALASLGCITALVPARNEVSCIGNTLPKLAAQGELARIILIDDESDDGTGELARSLGIPALTVLSGQRSPGGWSGKLWALEQGLQKVDSPYVLLMDADIALEPGILDALLGKLQRESLDLVSVMAALSMHTWWERLLIPPFIYFFKMIYPFALANSQHRMVAAAAGGCILIRTETLRGIGGFAALRNALIDDCTLARVVKNQGGKTWLGLSRDVAAARPYESVGAIWNMVARTAFTQLRYSKGLLAVCTLLLIVTFIMPIAGLFSGQPNTRLVALGACLAMSASYLPILRYYGRPMLWALTLPLAASLYLAMTWTSAIRYFRGERSRWKNRSYERDPS
ncbi:MAG: glycosyltransferase [Gammaproteobacteria bacterium]|nr:glycosyltransferase [Gammaproteobacteria bacterium]